MRIIRGTFLHCLFLLLPACTSHAVRCDGGLQPINAPTVRAPGGASAPTPGSRVPVPPGSNP